MIEYINAIPSIDFSFVEMPFLSCQVYVAIKYEGRLNKLTRAKPGTNTVNRKIACTSAIKAYCQNEGAGNVQVHGKFSCDEYPMASTIQGGIGAVTGCVPLCENNYQGQKMISLYSEVGVGEDFYVKTSGATDILCSEYISFEFPSLQSIDFNIDNITDRIDNIILN